MFNYDRFTLTKVELILKCNQHCYLGIRDGLLYLRFVPDFMGDFIHCLFQKVTKVNFHVVAEMQNGLIDANQR